jgi:hypothetical protein
VNAEKRASFRGAARQNYNVQKTKYSRRMRASDIGEKNDLAAKKPEKVRELSAAWNKWNAELIDPLWFPNRKGMPGGKKGGKGKKKAAAAQKAAL